MLAARSAVLLVVALTVTAHADVVTYLDQSRSVEALVEFSSDGGSPITYESESTNSATGLFNETASVAELSYESLASQMSDINAAGIWADGSVSLCKPLLGSDLAASQGVRSSLMLDFEVLTESPYVFDADFAFASDTGGMSVAFGSLTTSLFGPGGLVFEQSNSFPFPNNFDNINFSSGGVLSPGTYTFTMSAQISLNSTPYEIGGESAASYHVDLGVIPEPSAALLLAVLAAVGLRRA